MNPLTALPRDPAWNTSSIATGHILGSNSGVSAQIISNSDMSIAGMLKLHELNPQARILVVDNNPFSNCSTTQITEFLNLSRDWLRIVDHHGVCNDGNAKSTVPRLIAEFDELIKDGFLGIGSIVVTNAQNLDPDGILSIFCASDPEIAQRLAPLLVGAANYTDFALFGHERFDNSLLLSSLATDKLLGLALLQLITDEKARFVEKVTQTKIDKLSADEIRAVFMTNTANGSPAFNHSAVNEIYLHIINEKLPALLDACINPYVTDNIVLSLAGRALERAKVIFDRAGEVTRLIGVSPEYPEGKFALMSEETGFKKRLDADYAIYDWLLESAAQYCFEAPVHVRLYRGMLVISVRHPRESEIRNANYNLNPLIKKINATLIALGEKPTMYGREEVGLGIINTDKLSVAQICEILLQDWRNIEQPLKSSILGQMASLPQ